MDVQLPTLDDIEAFESKLGEVLAKFEALKAPFKQSLADFHNHRLRDSFPEELLSEIAGFEGQLERLKASACLMRQDREKHGNPPHFTIPDR